MARLDEIGDLDLYDEDGYREWTKRMIKLSKDMTQEISFSAGILYSILSVTPVSNPRTGIASAGDDSKYYARKVRGYLNRASQSVEFAGAQVAGGWSQFENGFLVPSNARVRGMKLHTRGGSSRGKAS